jgi:hypothetical protein
MHHHDIHDALLVLSSTRTGTDSPLAFSTMGMIILAIAFTALVWAGSQLMM